MSSEFLIQPDSFKVLCFWVWITKQDNSVKPGTIDTVIALGVLGKEVLKAHRTPHPKGLDFARFWLQMLLHLAPTQPLFTAPYWQQKTPELYFNF